MIRPWKINDYDFDEEIESKHTKKKKKLLNRTINALHLSIFLESMVETSLVIDH